MREKLVYVTTVITAFFIGIMGTIVVYSQFVMRDNIIERTIKEVSVTEADTISSAIDKIYDATLYIESFSGTRVSSSGTGFVYKVDDKNGFIITNNHVIEKASRVDIINSKGQRVTAKVLGADVYADIAVLSVEKDAIVSIATLGDSIKAKIGDTVFTVGSPLGLDYMNSVTKGILSGKDRTIEVTLSNGAFLMEVLQIDASINPGNSGGPLCNINGEVIGVNSLKLVDSSVEGMGFAIPIEFVMSMVEELELGKEVKRPMMGVDMVDVTDTWNLYRAGINIDSSITSGIVIISVTKDYPAAVSGLKKGDVVTEMDGVKIQSIAHFRFLLYKRSIGDSVTLKYNRDGKVSEVKVVLNKSVN